MLAIVMQNKCADLTKQDIKLSRLYQNSIVYEHLKPIYFQNQTSDMPLGIFSWFD